MSIKLNIIVRIGFFVLVWRSAPKVCARVHGLVIVWYCMLLSYIIVFACVEHSQVHQEWKVLSEGSVRFDTVFI